MRVSSTSISTFLLCPRKYFYYENEPMTPSEPMDFGTIVHALNELRSMGEPLTEEAVNAMEGNYDPPSAALERHPHLFEKALERHNDLYAWDPKLFAVKSGYIEKALDDYGLHFECGEDKVLAGGYMDMFFPAKRLIRDWKTRKNFTYAPRTRQDFFENEQLCYYAAAAAQVFGWDWVDVEHVNIMRDRSVFQKVTVRLPAWYLKGVWHYLESEVIPGMVEVMKQKEAEVETVEENCYAFGPCQHLNSCVPYNPYGEGADALDVMAMLV